MRYREGWKVNVNVCRAQLSSYLAIIVTVVVSARWILPKLFLGFHVGHGRGVDAGPRRGFGASSKHDDTLGRLGRN